MGRPFTVLRDKTDHGGTVMSAAPTSLTGGKPIARIGDKVPCPRCGNPNAVIVGPGDPTMIVDGAPVSLHGDKTSCGATIIASQMVTTAGGPGGAVASALTREAKKVPSVTPASLSPAGSPMANSLAAESSALSPYSPDMSAFSVSKGLDGQPLYKTSSESDALKLTRQSLQIPDGQAVQPRQVLNNNPGEQSMIGSLEKESSIVVDDGSGAKWARFADGRGLGDGVGFSDIDAGQPPARPQFSGATTPVAGVGMFNSAVEKWDKAGDLGKRQEISIYRNSRTGRSFVNIQDYKLNIGGNELEAVPVTKDEAMFRIDNLGSGG